MREWLVDNGVWGVGVLMFLQNILPVMPSELIMPLSGFLASLGVLPMKGVVLAGLLGSVLGHLPWYLIGFILGEERVESFVDKYGHWIFLRRRHIEKAAQWFDRNSVKAVLLGRLVPGLRTCVNIPAGTTRMAFLPFLGFTILGDAVWTSFLGYGGYIMGRDYKLIAGYVHLGLWIAVAAAAAVFTAWSYVRRHRHGARPVRMAGTGMQQVSAPG